MKILKKALFIDRDGTIIVEPPTDFQVDSLEKLEFIPKAITALHKIAHELDYELIMVTNQDGLGTNSFPEESFWIPHNKMIKTLENEGIHFQAVHIDRTFEYENAPTRKPRTGMLVSYMQGDYDLANSFVIGDRLTDVQLAKNLGANAIRFHTEATPDAVLVTNDWDEIYRFLKSYRRTAKVHRKTFETDVTVILCLDGNGRYHSRSGIGFFDHMLEQLAKHARIDLEIRVKGDLHIDEHHSIEDTALALGEAFSRALGDKRGIARYGFFQLPMDEALASVALDFSGRPYLVWKANFRREKIGNFPTEMFEHFFKSFSDAARCNLHIDCYGTNEHHQIEAIFKAFAKAIRMAIQKEHDQIPSTKGSL
ncbi:MAG: bifunctional histidinol-phosphatase/imidazoleglycerol-phosphate dehydratase HisB [Cytophagales bacterium]|nr:bifunctional histidinol-phosphatase/imidazoleglycerol-phosphate dehydratase HisB [Cytophagales bacterium]MDW8384944.1 bifunctional histidinol-phosphatase/imidazoleglycerol-phosphate dehydratase HisB [Flammeovirgaceae bacterium]